jgi:Zn-dependent protease
MGWDPTRLDMVFIWVLCVFLSILVHELGHAIASRYFGFPSEIVLYAMGGYATTGRFSTWRSIMVSAAGPAAGFSLGLIAIAAFLLGSSFIERYEVLAEITWNLMWINIFWTIVNLVPCLPLDGGRIMEALVYRYAPRQAPKTVMMISIIASGAVAIFSYQYLGGMRYMTILFALICAQTIMAYNSYRSF